MSTKDRLISLRIKALTDQGLEHVAALRQIVGDAIVDQTISDLYDELRKRA